MYENLSRLHMFVTRPTAKCSRDCASCCHATYGRAMGRLTGSTQHEQSGVLCAAGTCGLSSHTPSCAQQRTGCCIACGRACTRLGTGVQRATLIVCSGPMRMLQKLLVMTRPCQHSQLWSRRQWLAMSVALVRQGSLLQPLRHWLVSARHHRRCHWRRHVLIWCVSAPWHAFQYPAPFCLNNPLGSHLSCCSSPNRDHGGTRCRVAVGDQQSVYAWGIQP